MFIVIYTVKQSHLTLSCSDMVQLLQQVSYNMSAVSFYYFYICQSLLIFLHLKLYIIIQISAKTFFFFLNYSKVL